jgi:hypothetical protein
MLRPELDKSSVKHENELRIYLRPYLPICNGDRRIGPQALFSNTQFLGIYIGCLYEVLIGVADTAFATLRDRR